MDLMQDRDRQRFEFGVLPESLRERADNEGPLAARSSLSRQDVGHASEVSGPE